MIRRTTGRPARARRAPVLVTGALLSVLVLASCASDLPPGETIPGVRPGVTLPAPEHRDAAPVDEAAPVVTDEEPAPERTLASYAGNVVVVNFWASWCAPCRDEQPDLNEAYRQLADEPVVFVGVNINDTVPNAMAHEREFSMPYESLFDPRSTYAASFGAVGPRSIPATIILDAEGRVALRLFGLTNTIEVTQIARRLVEEIDAPAAPGAQGTDGNT